MRSSFQRLAIAIFALTSPIGAFANISGTATLFVHGTFDFDNGMPTSDGVKDISWDGVNIAFQGGATAVNVGTVGIVGFAMLTGTSMPLYVNYSGVSISAPALAPNDVFAVHTNGGNYAAVLVTLVNNVSVTLQYTTFGPSNAPGGPAITEVLNNYSLIPPGFPNAGIAPGSLMVIQGSNLADPKAQVVLQSSGGSGLPTTLNGASVSVSSGGVVTTPAIYYAIATQIAAVLPSNTPAGTALVTVTYGGATSGTFPIQVVPTAMGFDGYFGTPNGLGLATNPFTGAEYNYANAIPPGATVVLWGSGLGADPTRDRIYVPAAFPINNLAQLYIGGVETPIGYQGASGYPGVNQVNVTIPASAPTGCNVPVVGVTVAGIPSNFITLPIGNGPCSDPALGINGTQLQALSEQANVKVGLLGLSQATTPAAGGGTQVTQTGFANFQSVNGILYGAAAGSVSVGGCIVNQSLTGGSITTTPLDAGSLLLIGPTSDTALTSLPQGFIPATGGAFTVNGLGGKDIGPFTTSIGFPVPLLTWTNQSAAAIIVRAAGVAVTWSGGQPGTLVAITGTSLGPMSTDGTFTCIQPVEAGQFTVPGYVLEGLPPGDGTLTVTNESNFRTFTAPGLDYGATVGSVSYQINASYN